MHRDEDSFSLVVLQRTDEASSVGSRVGRSVLCSGETAETEERSGDGGTKTELHEVTAAGDECKM